MRVLFLGPDTSPVAEFLRGYGEEVTTSMEKIDRSEVDALKPDFIVSFGYRFLIRKDILDLYPRKVINLHISYLPWNRGADPNFWSFIEDSPKGVTIHYVDEGLDTGDIIVQRAVIFSDDCTLKTSYEKLQNTILELFKENWSRIRCGDCEAFPQPSGGSSHKIADREAFEDQLRELGYDTPVKNLRELRKKV